MSLDPRQPVLVGIGTCMQREDVLARSKEPMDLMLQAVRRAGIDAAGANGGDMRALSSVQHIAVPKGRWRYRNPAGEIARHIGAKAATTVLASVGVLQQSLIGDACDRIAKGDMDCALIVGADAGHRLLCAKKNGERAGERQQDDLPDVSLAPKEELLHPAELHAGLRMPVALYALLESAWRAKNGLTVDAHRAQLGRLYQRLSEVAANNPEAWRKTSFSAQEISQASERNPMQAFPYTRRHCATWNVDQAAALLICSAGHAQALGIAPSKWVYAAASSESNHMVPVSARADLAACDGARLAGHAALAAAGITASQLDLVELYSCFPIAVEAYAQELGIPLTRDLTVTGGMPFAGGPFNNYVLQATCRMAELLRQEHGSSRRVGLVSSVSGIMTKQGFGIWASQPGDSGFAFDDVSADTALQQQTKEVSLSFQGRAAIAGYTVLYDKAQAPRALVLADTDTGCRALAWSSDPALLSRMEGSEFCGTSISMQDSLFTLA
jgi:acetyl-CoA C-acetyltransferase